MAAAALYKNSAMDLIYDLFHQNPSFPNHTFNRNVDSDAHAADADAPDERQILSMAAYATKTLRSPKRRHNHMVNIKVRGR